jgi:hypothetical protein
MTFVGRQRLVRTGVCGLSTIIVALAIALGAPSTGLGYTRACEIGQLRHLVASRPSQNANGRTTLFRAFMNTGEACALDGFPTVVFVDRAGTHIAGGNALVRNEQGVHPQRVIVPRRELGFFRLSFRDGTLCEGHRFTIYGLAVIPFVHLSESRRPEPVCDRSAEVSPYRSTS